MRELVTIVLNSDDMNGTAKRLMEANLRRFSIACHHMPLWKLQLAPVEAVRSV